MFFQHLSLDSVKTTGTHLNVHANTFWLNKHNEQNYRCSCLYFRVWFSHQHTLVQLWIDWWKSEKQAANCCAVLWSCPLSLSYIELSMPLQTGQNRSVTGDRNSIAAHLDPPHALKQGPLKKKKNNNNSSSEFMQISPINLCELTLSVSASLSVSPGPRCPSQSFHLSHECLMVLPAAL